MENNEEYYPMPQHRQDDSNRTTKWKVDPEDVISEIGHNLRGDVFNEYDQEWTVPNYATRRAQKHLQPI